MPRIAPLVFVSSTNEDLAEYRAAVIGSFPAIDALYRGMEFFGARPDRPKDVIQRELSECDLYVGIIAHRYGSTDETGMSFTEFEYQLAKKRGKPRLMFLADLTQSVQLKNIETDPNRVQRLEQFKRALKDDHVVRFFTTAEDLATKILEGVRRWMSENEPEWKTMKQVPLADRENQHIRELYSSDPDTVLAAIRHLKRPDCRSSLEHFYGLLCRVETPGSIVKALLDAMQYFVDEVRVSQILLNLIEDQPALRVQSIETIFSRAIIQKTCTDAVLDRILDLSADASAEVRIAAVHALQNLGNNRADRVGECRRRLLKMKDDPDPGVKKRVMRSLSGLLSNPHG